MKLDKVKKQLVPSTSVLKKVDKFVDKINSEIKKKNINAKCVKGGSVAKGTFLKGDFDVDLFMKFDYSLKDKNISKILGEILTPFEPELVHGSRDYYQIKNELSYEVVPVLDIKNPAKAENVTDMSPLHVEWVKKNLKKGQDDEIRLTKKFCKAIGVYGAESYISGFSGHVVDILIIEYGSFLKLLEESKNWDPKVIIDPENYYKDARDILFEMNQSKIQGPMIIIDPILKSRNAASALSYSKFSKFKKRAQEFLKDPSEKYFKEKKIGKTFLKKKYKENLAILTLKAQKGKKDVVGSKILKAFRFMKSKLKKRGFELKDSGWYWNEKYRVLFWFVFEDMKLPREQVVEGPPLEMEDHVEDFKEKYIETFKKNKKIFSKVKVKKRAALANIKEIAEEDYFTEKIQLKKAEKF